MIIATLLTIITLYGLDKYTAPKEARWFYLHIWINAGCLISGYNDIYDTIADPINNYASNWTTSTPYAIIAAGHLYHMIMFHNLKYMDWLHHITMVVITLPWTIYMMPVKGAIFALSGLSGLPGGIDYVLLTLAKLGKIDWNTEKKYNNYIQVWLRTPWLLFSCAWGWMFAMNQTLHYGTLISFGFVFWNACFFMQDTLKANYVKLSIIQKNE